MEVKSSLIRTALVVITIGGPIGAANAQCIPNTSPSDGNNDEAAIQSCLNQGGTVLLERGFPGYMIAGTINITRSDTVLTSVGGGKAILLASPSLNGQILSAKNDSLNGYTISELIVDGNKAQRAVSTILRQPGSKVYCSDSTVRMSAVD